MSLSRTANTDRHIDMPRAFDAASNARAAGASKPAICAVLAVTAFILYGSLYPLVFHWPATLSEPFEHLAATWRDWDGRGDLLSNILLYSPFGFFLYQALPRRLGGAGRLIIAAAAGTLLSAGMELAQWEDEGRTSSMGDVYANGIGSVAGAVVAACLGAGLRWSLVRRMAEQPDVAILLAVFFGYRLYPYVPVVDMHKYKRAVMGLLQWSSMAPADLSRHALNWLLVAMLVHAVYGLRRWVWLFPMAVMADIAGKVMIVDATLSPADVAGAAIASIIWGGLLAHVAAPKAVTAGFVAMVIALRLQPFQFLPVPTHSFGWIPFWAMMHGSMNVAIQAFLEKGFQYGGIIWLLGRTGVPLPVGTCLTALMLFSTSYAEIYLPDRSAEITDAAMAVCIGGFFALLRHAGLSLGSGQPSGLTIRTGDDLDAAEPSAQSSSRAKSPAVVARIAAMSKDFRAPKSAEAVPMVRD